MARKPRTGKAKDKTKLTPKEKRFCDEYLVDLNGTAAFRRAGYKPKNDAVAASLAWRLLRKEKVVAYIQGKKAKLEEKTDQATRDLLEENRRLSFSDARKLFNADGSPKAIAELDDETAACIAGIEVEEIYEGRGENRRFVGYTRKYKLWDKNAAHDKRFRWKGLFKEPGSTPENPIQHKVIVEIKNAD